MLLSESSLTVSIFLLFKYSSILSRSCLNQYATNTGFPFADSIKSSKSKITATDIRNYFMNLDCFTSKDLKKAFPNCEITVRNALYLAKNSGLIKSTETRGEYLVIAKSQKTD